MCQDHCYTSPDNYTTLGVSKSRDSLSESIKIDEQQTYECTNVSNSRVITPGTIKIVIRHKHLTLRKQSNGVLYLQQWTINGT